MSKPFRSCAFASWVPEFVAASHKRSGLARQPSVAEIAAYRGLFALERVAVENLTMFLRHAIGPDAAPTSAGPLLKDRLLELNHHGLDIDRWCDRFLAQRLLSDGNARCVRALRTWYRLRSQETGRATEHEDGARAPASWDEDDPRSGPH